MFCSHKYVTFKSKSKFTLTVLLTGLRHWLSAILNYLKSFLIADFLFEMWFICQGWCCTKVTATTQKTALVPGWAWSTCLEKPWKRHVTNGMRPPPPQITRMCSDKYIIPADVRLLISPACVIVAISTAPTSHVQLCARSTVTDTTTHLMAWSMTTTQTARSICSKWVCVV